ncbi:brain-specific angiogenesis inhibitor 1-associated protein 2-like [Coregonus clupeaformis]|uniref:brain-specific angiogenesis inhibitor 1-associated protein 2-like n=1 Tax=Coregonus clupeaformis TaxID=59861 RepID=UPI001E1C3E99|nr:brain-specific angiogenesis inhibitor 1-associated protein 2-like [Coregonus clupeaformis]
MSRSDEVNKMTENVYKGILDQFNPSLKNFVTMGKHYEKALTGDTLFQMAEVHRQIQVQLEDVLKLFHSELLSQLEQKLELDIKYLTATLKKYQSERKSKSESIERCQSQLKKLRRKSQGSRHPNKYGDREMQYVELMSRRQAELDTLVAVGYRSALTEERRRYCFLVDRQCSVTKLLINYHCKVRELLSQKLSSWQQSCSQPTRLPERALNLLRHTAPQGSGASGIAELLRHAKLGAAQPEQRLSVQEVPPLLNGGSQQQRPIRSSSQSDTPPSPKLPRTPDIPLPRCHWRGHWSQAQQSSLLLATSTSSLSPSLIPSTVLSLSQGSPSYSSLQGLALPLGLGGGNTPLLSHNPMLMKAAEMYGTSTLPLPRRPVSEARVGVFMGSTLPRDRVLPLSSPSRVEAIFAHAPGGSEGSGGGGACLLHFLPGDALSLLISEPRDGWHYGQNERTGRKGWFPFSYTQPYPNTLDPLHSSSPLLSKVNSTSTGQLDKLVSPGLPALTPESEEECSFPPQRVSTFRPRPYSMADSNQVSLRPKVRGEGVEWAGPSNRPALSMLMQELSSDFASPPPTWTNPFAHIRLRKTVTNDRSAPIIE